ncbi:MAG: aquaporin family protein [Leptospira sp.]|nr:aquaporin family protein [Leptospira sp.]
MMLGEFLGTAVLIYFGNGVVAGALLKKSKSNNAGWISITAGWAFGVLFGIFTAKSFGSPDAHINPAVTLAFGIMNNDLSKLIPFFFSQVGGAMLGSGLVYLHYLPHWKEEIDPIAILSIHSTEPAIDHKLSNFISESFGTFILILGIYTIFHPGSLGTSSDPGNVLSAHFGALLVSFLVWAIGLSMGGTTGYAINPARDLGPRIMHSILPIPGKGSSRWEYSWIPIVAPFVGAAVAGLVLM